MDVGVRPRALRAPDPTASASALTATDVATFGAGQTVAVGQVSLANFNNPKGLVKRGSIRYGESRGEP